MPKLLNSWLALREIRVSGAEIALLGYSVIIVVSGILALLCSEFVGEYVYTMLLLLYPHRFPRLRRRRLLLPLQHLRLRPFPRRQFLSSRWPPGPGTPAP